MKTASKLWKVKQIITAFKKKSNTLHLTKTLCIDEQIVPFQGTTSLKQRVKNKPYPVGLKHFILAIPEGPVLDFVIYEGANTWPGGQPEPQLGVGGTVVITLLETVPSGHTQFVNRYFTSVNLMDYLREVIKHISSRNNHGWKIARKPKENSTKRQVVAFKRKRVLSGSCKRRQKGRHSKVG